jgi:hypothetical protein
MSNSKKVTAGAGSAAEVRPPPAKRRVFTAAEKLRIVKEADACGPGEVGALLRREGIYSSWLLALSLLTAKKSGLDRAISAPG